MENKELYPKQNHRVTVIGLGISLSDLTPCHMEIIKSADILVGGKRHLAFFECLSIKKRMIDRNLDLLFDFIREQMPDNKIVVLASGDPLFFGIGERLVDALGAKNVCFYPNISSIAAAFSKIKTPWHDAQVISLHGRGDLNDVAKSIHLHKKLAIMTSPAHTPAHIAKILLKEINGSVQFFVFERMGLSDETFDHYQLNQAANKTFLEPNLVVCIGHGNTQKRSQLSSCNVYLGMPDSCYIHEKNMITKAEVRVVSLSKLCLQSDHVLWDLGAGCGSVAIEASFFISTGKIVALEKNSRRISHIKQNKNKFHVHQLEIVQAVMPDGFSDLPAPDRIFIGGGGENLAEIIAMADVCLKPEGIIVINTVLIESLSEACFSLEQLGFEVDVTQVQISKSKKMPIGNRMAAQNPVWIVSGKH